MADSRARHRSSSGRRGSRRPAPRRPSLRLSGALLVGAVVLLGTMATTGPSAAAPAGTPTPVVNTAHSWFLGGSSRGFLGGFFQVVLQNFFHRLPHPGRPTPHPPTGGPTSAPPTTGTTTTTAAPPSTTTTDAPPPSTSTTAPAPGGDTNTNCTLIMPPGALTAAGLATPYRFTATDPTAGPCHEVNSDQSAFVEAAILDPATGQVSIYHPLVIDDGTQPAAAPVVPKLAPGAVVGIWFGFQADTLSLRHAHAHRGAMFLRTGVGDACVTGLPGSPFGQYSYCNAPRFFAAANAAIRAGMLKVPALGTGADGKPCPTTRDFSIVDQDQSDNLPTKYLALPDGRTAQDSPANEALSGATVLTNGSDNGLLDNHVDTALHCTPFTAPDLSAAGKRSPALALNELQAAADQGTPVALVPPNDPMTAADGNAAVAKTNLYRAGVDMPAMNPATDTGAAYCTNLAAVAPARLELDKPFTAAAASPDPAEATLFDFLVNRLTESWTNLGCQDLTGKPAPTVGGAVVANDLVVPTTAPSTTPAPVGTDPASATTSTTSTPATTSTTPASTSTTTVTPTTTTTEPASTSTTTATGGASTTTTAPGGR